MPKMQTKASAEQELAELRRKIEAWIRHGEAVPEDCTTYERWIVHYELRALIGTLPS